MRIAPPEHPGFALSPQRCGLPGKARAMNRMRPALVWLHRWAGLAMAGFLVIVGLTGSLLAYNFELERVFAPQLFAAERAAPRLPLAELAELAEGLVPHARVRGVLYDQPDQVMVYYEPEQDPRTGQARQLDFDEFFLDPWTGRELGRRRAGDLTEGGINLMPFVYRLHWTLVAGYPGQVLLGSVALLWFIDAFNGIALTLPSGMRGFWRRWGKAFRIKRGARGFRLHFDLHRASGLWFWPLVLVFAWSSVMMNIRPVYEAGMRLVTDYVSTDAPYFTGTPVVSPRLGWREAQATGERLLLGEAARRGVHIGERFTLLYLPEIGAYVYEGRGSKDLFERAPKGGGTSVLFDGNTGALRSYDQPTGVHFGNTAESWLYALHMARIFGRPYQALVCLFGIVTALLSATGVLIWLRKRRGRLSGNAFR